LDEAEPDLIVMPAADFLTIKLVRDPRPGQTKPAYIAYGPVALMEETFVRGCVDYLREPWTMAELRARLGRHFSVAFRASGSIFILTGSTLRCGGRAVELCPDEINLLRLLVLNAPRPVTREVFGERIELLAHTALKLRRKCKVFDPELGKSFHAIRGLGYRLDGITCG
jgi:DNA-binding response OmpR family regulator